MSIFELIVFTFISSFAFILLFISKKSKSSKFNSSNLEKQDEDHFHNDFTKIGSGERDIVVKPIHHYLEVQNEIDRDLKKLFPSETDKSSKES